MGSTGCYRERRAPAALHMSERTLRRRLAEEGVTFRGLLDEIGAQLAEELPVTGGMLVAEVAQWLGCVVSGFSQAFRRRNVGSRSSGPTSVPRSAPQPLVSATQSGRSGR